MTTKEQIEAVARMHLAVDAHLTSPWPGHLSQEDLRSAKRIISAYEQSRPAVATDEELLAAFRLAAMPWVFPESRDGELTRGIRAVRDRLGWAVVPELTDAMVDAAFVAYINAPALPEYSGQMAIRRALVAALAEAEREPDDAQ